MSAKWILRPSEIDTFLTCQRKWAFRYLDNVEPPASMAAQLGTAVHKVLETYLLKNEINHETIEGQIASPGLKFLPKNIPKTNVEKKIFFELDGYVFSGTPDFFIHMRDDIWLLGDHKTCSSFSSALTSRTLKENVQANIYARWLFLEKGAQVVKLKWIYYRTKGSPDAKCVESELTLDDNAKNWEIIAVATKIIDRLSKQKPSALALPKNTASCFKYGRCPYYSECRRGLQAIATKNISSTTDNALKECAMPSLPELKQNSFHLYIDCIPTKNEPAYEETIELSELLKPILTKIQKEKELSHYRLAGYGQHVGLIANYLSEHLKNSAYDNRTAILSSVKTPEGCDTLQTLSAAAEHVVRGF